MGVPIATERRVLTGAEFEAVGRSHYPDICGLPREDLIEVARRLREYRDKARDIGGASGGARRSHGARTRRRTTPGPRSRSGFSPPP